MRITQVSPTDIDGGVERTAFDLHTQFIERGIDAQLLLGRRVGQTQMNGVAELPRSGAELARIKLIRSLIGTPKTAHRAKLIEGIATPARALRWGNKSDDFKFDTLRALKRSDALSSDMLQYHSLSGRYLNADEVVAWSKETPTVVTVHDDWVMTGKCTSRMGCKQYLDGCSECDRWSHHQKSIQTNFAYKQGLWQEARFHIVTPSQWTLDQLKGTMFEPAIQSAQVIHNGVDIEVFKPGDKTLLRDKMDIPGDALVLLCGAVSAKNPIKNVSSIAKTIRNLKSLIEGRSINEKSVLDRLHVMILGGEPDEFEVGEIPVHTIPFIDDPAELARFIQTADLYVHASRADTFPRALVEAQACGLPVIATDVGGVKESFVDGETGILVPAGDKETMASALEELLIDEMKLRKMSEAARKHVEEHLTLEGMTDKYLSYYQHILESEKADTSVESTI